jgi:diguanylate cyclase (GGDEF)-like protein
MDETAQLPGDASLQSEIAQLRAQVATLQAKVEQLDALAHQDTLIELLNRRGFMRQLEGLIGRVSRYGEEAALLFVDLDGLKMINDSFGHPAGDEALIRVADLLMSGVRQGDCVARIGGDEFGILLAHADEKAAHETAERLVDRIAGHDFRHEGASLPLSVAIGVTCIEAGDSAQSVMARADAAMYAKKSPA